jgi:hypothetical protein
MESNKLKGVLRMNPVEYSVISSALGLNTESIRSATKPIVVTPHSIEVFKHRADRKRKKRQAVKSRKRNKK